MINKNSSRHKFSRRKLHLELSKIASKRKKSSSKPKCLNQYLDRKSRDSSFISKGSHSRSRQKPKVPYYSPLPKINLPSQRDKFTLNRRVRTKTNLLLNQTASGADHYRIKKRSHRNISMDHSHFSHYDSKSIHKFDDVKINRQLSAMCHKRRKRSKSPTFPPKRLSLKRKVVKGLQATSSRKKVSIVRNKANFENSLSKYSFSVANRTRKKVMGPKKLQTYSQKKLGAKHLFFLYKTKQYSEALKYGESYLVADPSHYECLYIVGVCGQLLKKQAKTIQYLSQLLDFKPRYRKTAYLFLAVAYKETDSISKGIQILTRALELFEDYYEAYVSVPTNSPPKLNFIDLQSKTLL